MHQRLIGLIDFVLITMSLLTKGRGLQTLSHEYFVTMVISETSSRLSQSWKLNKSTCQWNKPPRFLMLKKLEQVRWSVLLDKHCTYSQWLTQFDVPAAERSRQKFSQNFHWKVISSFSRPLNVCLFRNVERIQNLIIFFRACANREIVRLSTQETFLI